MAKNTEVAVKRTGPKVSEVFSRGLIKENPIFRLVLGMCSSLAVSSTLISALGMSVAVIIVLVMSNVVISMLRNFIPNTVRIPAYITVIAGFVTIVQFLLQALAPDINDMLGIYLPLIVVNCIILGRAEAFAGKNTVAMSAVDGLGMGVGYLLALTSIAFIREFIGAGSLFGMQIIPQEYVISLFGMPTGGFLVVGILMAVWNKIAVMRGKPKAGEDCSGCPSAGICGSRFVRSQKETQDEADEKIKQATAVPAKNINKEAE